MARALLIVNTAAGRAAGLSDPTRDICDHLSSIGELEVTASDSVAEIGAAARWAVNAGVDVVIAAGGDGTINEVVNALACSDVAMGIIPLGTANVLACELAIPIDDIPSACAVVLLGRERRVDLGRASNRCFAAMAGFGFDAAVVHSLDRRAKKVIGVGAYAIAISQELARLKPASYWLDIDGRMVETEASVVVVANSSCCAYGLKIAADARIDDGVLDVVVFEKSRLSRLGLLWQSVRVLTGTHTSDPGVRTFQARRIEVRSEPEVLMQLDGDEWGSTPMVVEIIPSALKVRAPD